MRIATIGTGVIVEQFIAAVKATDGVDIVAAYSRNKERAENFSQKNGILKHYYDLDAMFADPDVEAVYIASPNSLHYSHCSKALAAEKHVICEKPFTSNYAELKRLVELARTTKKMLFEAISVIHMPNFDLIRTLVSKLGRIRMVQCNYSQYSSKYLAFKCNERPNVFNPNYSGGALMDINVYNLHFLCALFGMPQDVKYLANVVDGIDTSGIVTLRYDDFVASCCGAKDSFSLNFAQIQGDQGYLNVTGGINGCPEIRFETAKEKITLNCQLPVNRLQFEVEHFNDILVQNDFARCYQELEHSLCVMKILDAARLSAGVHFPADA